MGLSPAISKWSGNLARFLTTLLAFQFLWALFVISFPGCLDSWLLWSCYWSFLLIGTILLFLKKVFQKRWLVWLFVFIFLNFTIGAFVSGRIQECACANDKKYCDVSDDFLIQSKVEELPNDQK